MVYFTATREKDDNGWRCWAQADHITELTLISISNRQIIWTLWQTQEHLFLCLSFICHLSLIVSSWFYLFVFNQLTCFFLHCLIFSLFYLDWVGQSSEGWRLPLSFSSDLRCFLFHSFSFHLFFFFFCFTLF